MNTFCISDGLVVLLEELLQLGQPTRKRRDEEGKTFEGDLPAAADL